MDHPPDHGAPKRLAVYAEVYPDGDPAPLLRLQMQFQCFLVSQADALKSSQHLRAISPHIQVHQAMYETALTDAKQLRRSRRGFANASGGVSPHGDVGRSLDVVSIIR